MYFAHQVKATKCYSLQKKLVIVSLILRQYDMIQCHDAVAFKKSSCMQKTNSKISSSIQVKNSTKTIKLQLILGLRIG